MELTLAKLYHYFKKDKYDIIVWSNYYLSPSLSLIPFFPTPSFSPLLFSLPPSPPLPLSLSLFQ